MITVSVIKWDPVPASLDQPPLTPHRAEVGRKSRKFITESKIFINSGQVGIISTFVATPSSLQPAQSHSLPHPFNPKS